MQGGEHMHFKLVPMYAYQPHHSPNLVFICWVWFGAFLDIVCHQTTGIDIYSILINLAAHDGYSEFCWEEGSVSTQGISRRYCGKVLGGVEESGISISSKLSG